MDQGIRGFDPEPRRGYRSSLTRDRILQEFSDAVWQRHEARGSHSEGPLSTWPSRADFRDWPFTRPGGPLSQMAFRLIVADWKVAQAAAKVETDETVLRTYRLVNGKSLEIAEEIDAVLLDPPPTPERDWRAIFALELASQPELLFELAPDRPPGDGIELVLERAQLSSGERWVMRDWLNGKDVMLIAADSGDRPQTVGTLLRNGLYRLRWLGQATSRKRGDVRYAKAHAGRASDGHVSVALAPRNGTHQEPGASRGSRSGHIRGLPAPAARGAHRQAAAPLDAERAS